MAGIGATCQTVRSATVGRHFPEKKKSVEAKKCFGSAIFPSTSHCINIRQRRKVKSCKESGLSLSSSSSSSSFFFKDNLNRLVLSRKRECTAARRLYGNCTDGKILQGNCTAVLETTDGQETKVPRKRKVGRGSRLIGSGSAIPSVVISNDRLSTIIETNDEWIATRTGIRNRRVLSGTESLTELAVDASKKALEMANVDPKEVDLVILCTSTPEDIFGGACQVQAALGCKNAVAFDLTAACSGFVMGLVTATRFIQGGGYEKVLVIGADALSRYVDWTDRGTCILFGDGCGAVLLRATVDDEEDGLLGFDMRSDGDGNRHLHAAVSVDFKEIPENGSAIMQVPSKAHLNFIEMNGKEVFKFAVRAVPQVVNAAMEEAGLTSENVDWLLLHQANQRILDAVAQKMSIPSDRVISNLRNYGNTSAASIPLALDEAVRERKVQPGHVVATAGFGAGLTWASVIFRWG